MQKNYFPACFNGFHLKYIALLTMTIDHIAAVLLIPGTAPYEILRAYGRIAFPVFCFLLTEGYLHTSNHKAYLKRLFFFALISELPFDMALYHFPMAKSQLYMFLHQNIFFTLALGFLSMYLMDRFFVSKPLLSLFWAIFPAFLSQWLHFDYGALGIFVILLFYGAKKIYPQIPRFLTYFLALLPLLIAGDWKRFFVLFSLPLLLLYNGQKGQPQIGGKKIPGGKFFFYWYYPCHLFFLAILYFIFV